MPINRVDLLLAHFSHGKDQCAKSLPTELKHRLFNLFLQGTLSRLRSKFLHDLIFSTLGEDVVPACLFILDHHTHDLAFTREFIDA